MNYIAFKIASGEVLISTRRAAKNMAYQCFTDDFGKFDVLLTLKGQDIMGLPLRAPLSVYDVIYTLPMLTIREDKGQLVFGPPVEKSKHNYRQR